jgi:hypothetical protein
VFAISLTEDPTIVGQILTWYDVMFVVSCGSPRHLLLPEAFLVRVSLAGKNLLQIEQEM